MVQLFVNIVVLLKVVDPICNLLKHHKIMQGWKIFYYDDVYEIL